MTALANDGGRGKQSARDVLGEESIEGVPLRGLELKAARVENIGAVALVPPLVPVEAVFTDIGRKTLRATYARLEPA